MFGSLQHLVVLVLSVVVFIAAVWAFIDATRYSNAAYQNASKNSKTLWLVILGVATLIGFVSLPWPIGAGSGIIGLFGIAAVIAVVYYFVDVRPKVAGMSPGSGGPRRSSGGW